MTTCVLPHKTPALRVTILLAYYFRPTICSSGKYFFSRQFHQNSRNDLEGVSCVWQCQLVYMTPTHPILTHTPSDSSSTHQTLSHTHPHTHTHTSHTHAHAHTHTHKCAHTPFPISI